MRDKIAKKVTKIINYGHDLYSKYNYKIGYTPDLQYIYKKYEHLNDYSHHVEQRRNGHQLLNVWSFKK